MGERLLRYFGEKEDLIRAIENVGLDESDCRIESSDDFDHCVFVGGDVTDETYFDLCDRIDDGLYAEKDVSVGEALVSFARENGLTIATAESCTGGLVAAKIVGVAGASKVFHEGLVTYSNQSKIERLSVDERTIAACGAVSRETACEMAYGLVSEYVDLGIATTGVAGPATDEGKPVGLVYIGIAYRDYEPVAYKFNFSGDRDTVRRNAANAALFYAYRYLQEIL